MFDQSSNLNKHYLTHMGQKPYQCQDCGDKFSQTSNLAKHMRKHGRNDCNSPSLSPVIVDQPNQLVNHQIPVFMMTNDTMALFSNHNQHNHSNHSRSSTATPVFVTDTNKFISG
ncbi:hypothetical protein BLA29_003750 [Euroglyphus maynei]|uniref:C2H2-type domain-containing protein n=1 Tax=Euroglyphus maynei TaxID=6958 RepID=A0A1Y3BL37_EURMA|nr:hypothetical protein BLA29_003750 [Euroglyphus maynei]